MIAEAQEFAEEDKATSERIQARNGFENYVFSLKNQANDEEGLGGKIDEDDKETLLEAVKEASDWLDSNSADATTEDFEEQKEKLSNVAYPITSKLYGSAGGEALWVGRTRRRILRGMMNCKTAEVIECYLRGGETAVCRLYKTNSWLHGSSCFQACKDVV